MIRGVHHINFLVRDLDEAVDRYQRLLGVRIDRRDELPGRGVHMARFRAGETWIVLVQPVADGEPMRYLEEHGEGFFLISYGVDDIAEAVASLRAAGGHTTSDEARTGLDGWRVIDIAADELNGTIVQLCQDDARRDRP